MADTRGITLRKQAFEWFDWYFTIFKTYVATSLSNIYLCSQTPKAMRSCYFPSLQLSNAGSTFEVINRNYSLMALRMIHELNIWRWKLKSLVQNSWQDGEMIYLCFILRSTYIMSTKLLSNIPGYAMDIPYVLLSSNWVQDIVIREVAWETSWFQMNVHQITRIDVLGPAYLAVVISCINFPCLPVFPSFFSRQYNKTRLFLIGQVDRTWALWWQNG